MGDAARHLHRAPAGQESRVPPGQYVTGGFPVLSAGPTPHTPLENWTFSITQGGQAKKSWTWQSAKWVRGLDLREVDEPGFWETYGYHIYGDPYAGIGKTVLLEWAAGQALDMQLARVAGIQAEMGMGFAGLHQLLVPFLGGLDGLPGPQRQALGSAFGLLDGPPSDRFLVGLAALTLLTDAAAGRPVLCLVDDAQWLDQVSGAVPLGWPLRFGGRPEELYLARVRALPAGTQTLLLVAAADPTGDPALVFKAAGQLGTGPEAGEAAGTDRLVSWQPRVWFRHPLIRSAAYYAAPASDRHRAHAALAAVSDPGADPDRRAWHLAEAAAGPDEQVAAELEQSAGRAQARGGLAAAAVFLERAATLTPDPFIATVADEALWDDEGWRVTVRQVTNAPSVATASEALMSEPGTPAGQRDLRPWQIESVPESADPCLGDRSVGT